MYCFDVRESRSRVDAHDSAVLRPMPRGSNPMMWNCSRAAGVNNFGRLVKKSIPDPLGPPGLISTLPAGFGPVAFARCNPIEIFGPTKLS